MMTHKSEGSISQNLKNNEITKDILSLDHGIRKEMNLPFGFEPDADWLPVKTVLEKPIKPDTLLKAVEENIRK
jgi:hypothetical protein